jgi:hypothetical protein
VDGVGGGEGGSLFDEGVEGGVLRKHGGMVGCGKRMGKGEPGRGLDRCPRGFGQVSKSGNRASGWEEWG